MRKDFNDVVKDVKLGLDDADQLTVTMNLDGRYVSIVLEASPEFISERIAEELKKAYQLGYNSGVKDVRSGFKSLLDIKG